MTADLARLRPYVEILAAERTRDKPHLFADAVQEGMISAWRASVANPGKPGTYYRAAAKNGVNGAVGGRPFTGHVGRRGWQDAHTHAVTDAEREDAPEWAAQDALDAVEDAGRVRAALASIPDVEARQDAFMRFWQGMTWQDVADVRGVPKQRLERRWREHVRPALREALAGVA